MTDVVPPTTTNVPREDSTLHVETMLIEEYRYASQTAMQSLSDRNRVVEQYLLVVGATAVAAIGAVYQLSQVGDQDIVPLVLLSFFIAVGMLGVVSFIALIRLRQASRESTIAMNVIKEFYIGTFKKDMPSINYAFRWRLVTIPSGERAGSITFLYSYTVAFLSSLSFAAAAVVGYQLVQAISGGHTDILSATPVSLLGGVTFLFFLICYIYYYRLRLSRRRDHVIIDDAKPKLDKDQ